MRTEPVGRTNLQPLRRGPQAGAGELWRTVLNETLAEADQEEQGKRERQQARLAASASLRGGRWSPRTYVLMMVDQYGDRLQAHVVDQDHDCLLRHIGEQELAGMQRELVDYAGMAKVGARCSVVS